MMYTKTGTYLKTGLLGATAALALGLAGCDKEAKPAEEMRDMAKGAVEVMGFDADDASPIDKKFVLKDAEPLEMDGFMSLMNQREDGGTFKFASSEFDKSIGATVLTDVSTTDDDGAMTVGRMELYGMNADYIQRLKNEDVSDTKESVFRKVRMFDLNLSGAGDDGNGSVTIGAVEIDNLKIGGFDPAKMEETEENGPELAAIMNGIEIGGVFLKDMKVNGLETDGTGVDMVIADLRFGGFNGGTIGPVLIKNLDYTVNQSAEAKAKLIADGGAQMAAILNGPIGNLIMPEKMSATMERMTWDGMSFAGLLPYLANGEEPPIDAKNLLAFGKIEAFNAVSFVNGKKAAETGYSVVDPIEFSWFVPTRIRSASKDTTLDMTAYVPDGQDEILAVLTDAGLTNVTGDGELVWDYDEKMGDASLVYDAKMTGFANIAMNFNLSNAVLETLHDAHKAGDETAMMNMQLDGFSLKIEDEKLLDMVFGIAALQMGQEPEQLRASAPLFISMGGAQFAEINPAIPGYLEALSGWITNGGSLEIRIAPEEPLSLGALAIAGQTTPQTLPDVLGLTVTHSE